MDVRLLKHYETELSYLRKMGAEFAESYPKIAARLGMEGIEVADPYVERLLEGSAFLAARVQLELDLQYPAFASHLFEIVYPQFLSPTPSMMVVQLDPDMDNAALQDGHRLARDTRLIAHPAEGASTRCEYRTAHDVTLWPVSFTEAEYIDGRGALVAAGVAGAAEARAAIRLRLTRAGGAPLAELSLDQLGLYLGGADNIAWALYELLGNEVTAVTARSIDRRNDWVQHLPGADVVLRGFDWQEALLPTPAQSFDGYRLLQEYFAMPQRFRFVDVSGIAPALARVEGDSVDLYLLLRDGNADIGAAIQPGNFALHCTPAVNLFERRCDRVPVTHRDTEHHVVVDRTASMDYEVYAVASVKGISNEGEANTDFLPFYAAGDFTPLGGGGQAYYTVRRRMRQRTEKERLRGARTSYLGSETYLDLVDTTQAPYSAGLAQLALKALVTNRDLPMLLSTGGADVFQLTDGGPVARITTPFPPTKPRPSLAQGDVAWRLISQLSLNYLSLTDGPDGNGAAALREMLGVHAPPGDKVIDKQLAGIVRVDTAPKVRRLADEVLSTAVRGLEITVTCDEEMFKGSSIYLLGAVLDRFFQKYVTMNSFTETVLRTDDREVARWRPRAGTARLI